MYIFAENSEGEFFQQAGIIIMIYEWRAPIFNYRLRNVKQFCQKMAAINQTWQTLLETGKQDM